STETSESADGLLRSAITRIVASRDTTVVEAAIDGAHVTLVRRVGGQSFTSTIPFEGTLLGPEAVRRRTVRELAAPGDSLVYQSFLSELGAIGHVVRRVVSRERVTCDGNEIDALK